VDALLVTDPVNVRYLTGFTGSNGQVLVTPDGAVFFTDGRYTEQAGHQVRDAERVTYEQTYRDAVSERTRSGIGRLGFEARALTVADHAKLAEALGAAAELVPVDGLVEDLRVVKDADEHTQLRRAQAVTDAAFDVLLDHVARGATEQQVARELERVLIREGADGLAFDPIVAFGENAAEPHHAPGHRPLEEGDLIKLDFGAEVAGYHADMTRTVAFGTAATELRKIHDVVRQAQEAGIDAVAVGVSGAEVDAASRGVIEGAGYGDRFVHGLGHGVGLEIHERPWLGKRQDEPLPAGTIVTVEPGIYIPGLGGVRIEDMVEVTADGGRVLGTSSRELIEL
jgi:Xaa-Pro aminopeptidase